MITNKSVILFHILLLGWLIFVAAWICIKAPLIVIGLFFVAYVYAIMGSDVKMSQYPIMEDRQWTKKHD